MNYSSTGVRLPADHGEALTDFTEGVFGYLPRADQRRWARAYLEGLLGVEGKKSLSLLARAAPHAQARHGLQQFINGSPWDWRPGRDILALTAHRMMPVRAWTAGILNIPKRGEHSVGVHRRFVPQLGRTVNCQVATGLFVSSEGASVPVDWSLYLDESWDSEEDRRRARIPDWATAKPLCMEVLDLTDRMLARTGTALPLVADLRVAWDVSHLAGQLTRRGVDFVFEVKPSQQVSTRARTAGGEHTLTPVREVGAGEPQTRSTPDVPYVTSRSVRLPGAPGFANPLPEQTYRLLTLLAPGDGTPRRYWLTSMLDQPVDAILSLARNSARTHGAMAELEVDFGALDFEGRSFPGWHHHMTMVSTAYLYRNLLSGRGVQLLPEGQLHTGDFTESRVSASTGVSAGHSRV